MEAAVGDEHFVGVGGIHVDADVVAGAADQRRDPTDTTFHALPPSSERQSEP